MADYAHPEVLVSTDWLKQNLKTPNVRVVEVDVDPKLYAAGHIPGAVGWDWTTQLNDQVRRDIISKEDFEKLNSEAGIKNSDTVIIYGDASNWFAAYGFWLYKIYGHKDVRLLNGGRAKWLNEEGAALTTEVPKFARSQYKVGSGRRLAAGEGARGARREREAGPPGGRPQPRRVHRKGHRPAGDERDRPARRPHARGHQHPLEHRGDHRRTPSRAPTSCGPSTSTRSGSTRPRPTIAYCRIGERSSHTWFVLKYLLGFKDVKNYDGSWTEYGNLIGAPIEKR